MADSIHVTLNPLASEALDYLTRTSGLSRNKSICNLLEAVGRERATAQVNAMLSHALYLLRAGKSDEAEKKILEALEVMK